MDTSNERMLIEDAFAQAFASSLQVNLPDQDVVEHFVSFVISEFFNERKIRSIKTRGLESKTLDERFIYSCIPLFINYLEKNQQ